MALAKHLRADSFLPLSVVFTLFFTLATAYIISLPELNDRLPLKQINLSSFNTWEDIDNLVNMETMFPNKLKDEKGYSLAEMQKLMNLNNRVTTIVLPSKTENDLLLHNPTVKKISTSTTLSLIVVFGLSILSGISYITTLFTCPGTVPKNSNWTNQDLPPPELDGCEQKWCTFNEVWKPERAHRCSQTGLVILRMDHYCPWTGTTIGIKNHKQYILFLYYGTMFLINILISTSFNAMQLKLRRKILVFTMLSSGFLALLTFVPLLGFQIRLLLINQTTIEWCEQGYSNKYDLGILENIYSIFGYKWWFWFIPITTCGSNGIVFPTQLEYNIRSSYTKQSLEMV